MIIYNRDGSVLLDIEVDDTSVRHRSIMQENSVTLNYSLKEHVEVPIFSYIKHNGEIYTLWRPENFTKESCRNFKYTVVFGGEQEVLKNYKYKFFIANPKPLDFTFAPELKFPITAEPQKLIDLLVDNLNLYEKDPAKKWKRGDCIEAKPKVFSVNHDYCWDILQRIASEFETEWEIENRTIHLRKVEKYKDNPLKLSYGKGNGFLKGVGRQNRGEKAPVTILYVQGGDRNIVYDGKEGSSKTLLLPKEQELSHGNGSDVRRYKTDKHGTYIVRADKELKTYNEDSYDGSHFYPSYVGKITEMITLDATEEEKEKHKDENFKYVYDFKDSEINDSLNFEDYLIKGEDMTIIFQSGKLTGREFKVKYVHTDKDGKKERRFKIYPERMDGVILPCDNLKPMVGDEYAVFHIDLPKDYVCNDTYQTGASWDMYREAVKYFYENEHEQFSFSGKLDPIWAKKKWNEIGGKIIPGGYVEFSDTHFQPDGILIRITGVTDYINSPYTPDIDLSNAPVAGSIGAELGKIEAEEVVNEQRHNDSIKLTERRFRDAQETGKMLIQAALEGFGEAINPILVNTMQLLVGSEQLQFRFINQYNQVITPYSEMDDTAKVLKFISSNQTLYLQHMTLGITQVSPTHSNYKYWRMPSYVSHYLGDNARPYFLYAKCNKSGGSGNMASYVLSPDPIRMDGTMVSGNKGLEDTSCYHFLIGTLGSESEGKRSFETLYGFTEILPGRITTGMIKSSNGQTYFNLTDGEIGGRIVFKGGSTGYGNIEDRPNLDYWANTINQKADANSEEYMKQARNDLAYSLGYSNYTKLVEAAQKGSTTIDGGFIRTSLIDADAIVTKDLVAERVKANEILVNEIVAKGLTADKIAALNIKTKNLEVQNDAKIGNFTIKNGNIYSPNDGMTLNAGGSLTFERSSDRFVRFGTNVVAPSSGGNILMWLNNSEYNIGGHCELARLTVGASYDTDLPKTWLNCDHAEGRGWGSKFVVESRIWAEGTSNGMERTVINVGTLMTKSQLIAWKPKSSFNFRNLIIDANSGYIVTEA